MSRVEIAEALPRVAEIVADVRARGDEAVLDWTERFDGSRPAALRVPAEEIAASEVDPAFLTAVRRLADAVRAFHEPQRPPDTSVITRARRPVPNGGSCPSARSGSTRRAGAPPIRPRWSWRSCRRSSPA